MVEDVIIIITTVLMECLFNDVPGYHIVSCVARLLFFLGGERGKGGLATQD